MIIIGLGWRVCKAGANQPIHSFLGGKGLDIQQGTSVWVGSAKLGMQGPNQLF